MTKFVKCHGPVGDIPRLSPSLDTYLHELTATAERTWQLHHF